MVDVAATPESPATAPQHDEVVRMRDVTIRFPGVLALDRVDLTLRAGEVPEPARGPAVGSFREASRVLAGLEPEEAPA